MDFSKLNPREVKLETSEFVWKNIENKYNNRKLYVEKSQSYTVDSLTRGIWKIQNRRESKRGVQSYGVVK